MIKAAILLFWIGWIKKSNPIAAMSEYSTIKPFFLGILVIWKSNFNECYARE